MSWRKEIHTLQISPPHTHTLQRTCPSPMKNSFSNTWPSILCPQKEKRKTVQVWMFLKLSEQGNHNCSCYNLSQNWQKNTVAQAWYGSWKRCHPSGRCMSTHKAWTNGHQQWRQEWVYQYLIMMKREHHRVWVPNRLTIKIRWRGWWRWHEKQETDDIEMDNHLKGQWLQRQWREAHYFFHSHSHPHFHGCKKCA